MTPSTHSVGVVGAGTMGHGIAHVAALAGFKTTLYDVTLDAARAGRDKVAANLDAGVARGKVTAEARTDGLARLGITDSLETVAQCQVIIEAIPEKLALKQELFLTLSQRCARDTLLATNTSSLSVTEIAAVTVHPERVVGLHFFNPVHVMKLLEVVRAFQTSDATLEAARAFGTALGKQLVVVNDAPGFASTRLGIALGMEAIRMVEEGVAAPEDIDRAMELGYGFPMGPLKLTDLVGLDVRLAIAEYLHHELGMSQFRPPQLLKKMVRAGKLGRKSGEGFYRYDT